MTNSVCLLVNLQAGSGRARSVYELVRNVVRANGYDAEIIAEHTPKASIAAIQTAINSGAKRFLVIGGDGTLNMAIQSVARTDAVLGIVPAGTGNDFASAFGLCGATVEQATKRALGAVREIDLIKVRSEVENKLGKAESVGSAGSASESPCGWIASVATGGFSTDVSSRSRRMRFSARS